MAPKFEEILSEANPVVRDLALEARQLVLEIMPAAVEVVWPNQKIASYGVGPKKMSEHFTYIAVLKNRINLGLYYGADLDDPQSLLEGTGKSLRHIKVAGPEQLRDPALRQLLQTASGYYPKLETGP